MINVSISSLTAPSCSNPANVFAASTNLGSSISVPTMILDGYKLSYKAFDSLKNSGEKIIFLLPVFSLIL